MAIESIISAIDAEIAMLQQARSLLAEGGNVSTVATRKTAKVSAEPTKRVMSPEARKLIGDAQRKRWARTKKASAVTQPTATKNAAKKASPAKAKKAAPKKAAKRSMSPEARQRIGDAQRERWSATKKLAELSAVSKRSNKIAKRTTPKISKAPSAAILPEKADTTS